MDDWRLALVQVLKSSGDVQAPPQRICVTAATQQEASGGEQGQHLVSNTERGGGGGVPQLQLKEQQKGSKSGTCL